MWGRSGPNTLEKKETLHHYRSPPRQGEKVDIQPLAQLTSTLTFPRILISDRGTPNIPGTTFSGLSTNIY